MVNKRKKNTRHRGSHSHKRGFKKKARGSGHRGGFGLAGTGKRGDQKKTLILKTHKGKYFGKSKTLRKRPPLKLKSINLDQISSQKTNLTGYKILSRGEAPKNLKLQASAASIKALEKLKSAGTQLTLPAPKEKKENKKPAKDPSKDSVSQDSTEQVSPDKNPSSPNKNLKKPSSPTKVEEEK